VSRHLRSGFPLALRISGRVDVAADHPALGGQVRRVAPAQRILDKALRLRNSWPAVAPGPPGPVFATARVRLADGGPGSGSLTALGVWGDVRLPPAQVWLTNVRAGSAPALLSLTRLHEEVTHGWRTRGDAVGLRDFEGRSLRGWHRHMTLASCAYAISALSSAAAAGYSAGNGEAADVFGRSA
jgi:hypothetical protein